MLEPERVPSMGKIEQFNLTTESKQMTDDKSNY